MGSEAFAGYPLPVLVPAEVRADPDEDNPHELVLDGSQVNPALPPLDLIRRPASTDDSEAR